MRSGEISGNNGNTSGGVLVYFGTFIMEDGEISGNTAVGDGGGVSVIDGTFTMQSGEISGNTASNGGGVYVSSSSTFSKTSGTIYGDTDATHTTGSTENTATSAMSGRGHAVYYSVSPAVSWDADLNPGDNLSCPIVVSDNALTALVTAPATGAAPNTTAINQTQYTGTIAWQNSDETPFTAGSFVASTQYRAVVSLTAETGYTFDGLAADSFTYTGATVTNPVGSGTTITVTIEFPATGP
jgi:hypothetical protein